LRAEGHADADFAGALADRIGDDSIETNDAEKERQGSESSDDPCRRSVHPGRGGVVEAAGHGAGLPGGEAGIDAVNGGGDGGEERVLVLRGAEDDGEVVGRRWIEGDGEGSARGGVELAFLNVVDDADDADMGVRVAIGGDLLADGILIGEELLRELLVDDADEGMRGVIALLEELAADELGLESGEVARTHFAVDDFAEAVVMRLTDDGEDDGAVAVAKGEHAGEGNGADAGKGGYACLDLTFEGDDGGVLFVGGAFGGDLESGEVVGNKSGIGVEETVEALAEEAGADQEHDGHGEFNDDEVRAEATPDVAGETASAGGKVCVEVGEGDAECGHEGEEYRGGERNEDGKKDDAEVEAECCEPGHAGEHVFGDEAGGVAHGKEGECGSEDSGSGGEYDAFSDEEEGEARA